MEAWSIRRDRQIQFLKLQVELLRAKLPVKHVILSPEDRARMLQAGAAIGHNVDDLLGIVSVKTYRRWRTQQASGQQAGRVGRPRSLTRSARALILRLARENKGWGVRRIIGELKKLGLPSSRSTVRRLLTHEGVLPDPHRHAPKGVMTPWRTFVSAHANVMVATDFFCKSVWTPMGKKLAYCLMFIHLGSRKVMVSPATFCPGGDWVAQQARNAQMWLEDEKLCCQYILHDHDAKFTEAFDELFTQAGAKAVATPIQAPIANCYAESWIGSFKRECLNHLICFSAGQLDFITAEYSRYYNRLRPHQSMGNTPLHHERRDRPQPAVGRVGRERILGGLLNHYYRRAA
jgi:putative transposase